MYMFDLNWWLILWVIIAQIQIKDVHSTVSYQQATHQKYDRHGRDSPSGYDPLVTSPSNTSGLHV